MMKNSEYDWIVVGGGISGISLAEILCREGKSVLLLEKNETLASETSKVFHEWMHSGALYTLVSDNLLTLRYLLGATDDLLEYYSCYPRMNLNATESGVLVKDGGWFNDNKVEFRYRIRKWNPAWMAMVSRSINIINLISKHDWLRRRAGSEYGNSKINWKQAVSHFPELFSSSEDFFKKTTPDLTMNSRMLIDDFLSFILEKSGDVRLSCPVQRIHETGSMVKVDTACGEFVAKNLVVCSPDYLAKQLNIPVKVSYAPIAVVRNIPETEKSFVELDVNSRNCINLLKKTNGIGQAGGISLTNEGEVNSYLQYVIAEHKKRNPAIEVVDSYVGLKKEFVQTKEDRNYLYHINQQGSRVWSVVLGKFSLAFSMAPEFYRRVYNENPVKFVKTPSAKNSKTENMISLSSWQEIALLKGTTHGHD